LEQEIFYLKEESENQFRALERKDEDIKKQGIELKTLRKRLSEKSQPSFVGNKDIGHYKRLVDQLTTDRAKMEVQRNQAEHQLMQSENLAMHWQSEFAKLMEVINASVNDNSDIANKH
jgi:hypothetical protein